MMTATLEHRGFKVVSAANVTEALKHIATESFDVLLTDLHMPNPGDDFTVVTAMRHSRPDALTLLVSGYPDVPEGHGRYTFGSRRNCRKTVRCRKTR
jgi:DNA-binding NtrC family response regulator